MKIDIHDIKFWMDAIRNSEDKERTLESFTFVLRTSQNGCENGLVCEQTSL